MMFTKIIFIFLILFSQFVFADWLILESYCPGGTAYANCASVAAGRPNRLLFDTSNPAACSSYTAGTVYRCQVWVTSDNPCPNNGTWNYSTRSCDSAPSDCSDGSSFNEWGRCPSDQCPAGSWSSPEITEPYPNGSCPKDQCSDGSVANEAYGCPDPNTSSASSDSNGNSSAVNTSSAGQQNSTGTASSVGDSGGSSGTGSSSGDGGGQNGGGGDPDGNGGDSGGSSGTASSSGGDSSEGGDSGGSSGTASSVGNGTASGGQNCDSPFVCDGDAIQCAILENNFKHRCNSDKNYTDSGNCDDEPACDGDPIQCAIALEAFKTRCVFDIDKEGVLSDFENGLEDVDSDNDGIVNAFDSPAGSISDVINLGEIYGTTDIFSGYSCPQPLTGQLLNTNVEISFDFICEIASKIRPFIIALGYLFAGFILYSGIVRK